MHLHFVINMDAHVVKVTIDVSDAQSIAQRPYRVPDKMKTQVEEQIRKLLEEGIIEESTSYWASPVVPVISLMDLFVYV